MKKLLLSFVLLTGLLMSFPAFRASAEPIAKHPRVVELEDRIAKDANAYLRSRFPDRPFLVTVSVDPLRRVEPGQERAVTQNREKLPYLDLQNEEIQDEWDDPQISLNELMLRIRKIQLTVSLPSSVLDSEIIEIKAGMYSVLHLLNARDEIVIERKPWKETGSWGTWMILAVGVMLLFLIGNFAIIRNAIKKLSSALADTRGAANVHVSNMNAGGPASAGTPGGGSTDKGMPQDVQLSDPIKIRELASRLVMTITANPNFPSHLDMFELDQTGRRNPAALGAVLSLFPTAMQRKIFSMSYHSCWLQAMNRPGTPSFESLEMLHRLMRNPHENDSADWERLIILVWRLDEKRADFLRQIDRGDAMTVLSALPKSLSVATARLAFPGGWADILNPRYDYKPLNKEKITEISQRALEFCPLNDYSVIERYKNEHELLEYIRTADIAEERDIYLVSPPDAMLHQLRPPFYRVFEASDEDLKSFVPRFAPQQWALALFNINRAERRKIDQFFTDKQRFLLIENLKRFDNTPPDKNTIGEIREFIARVFHETVQLEKVRELKPAVSGTAEKKPDEAGEDPHAAAA